jgi:hypothetical protein
MGLSSGGSVSTAVFAFFPTLHGTYDVRLDEAIFCGLQMDGAAQPYRLRWTTTIPLDDDVSLFDYAHRGLKQALHAAFPGLIWQRCHTEESLGVHFRRNVIDQTPPPLRDRMHDRLDAILTASAPVPAREAREATLGALEGDAEKALRVLEDGFDDATAVLALPPKYRRRLRTTNMVERLIEEIRRRERVVRIFPTVDAARRLIGARRAEQHEEWSTGRRYLTMDAFFAWKHDQTHSDSPRALPHAA